MIIICVCPHTHTHEMRTCVCACTSRVQLRVIYSLLIYLLWSRVRTQHRGDNCWELCWYLLARVLHMCVCIGFPVCIMRACTLEYARDKLSEKFKSRQIHKTHTILLINCQCVDKINIATYVFVLFGVGK